METHQRVTSGKKKALALVVVLLALSLVLSGCIGAAPPAPTFRDVSLGTVRVSQGITAADIGGHQQTLDEYGVFYSTSRDAVVRVDGNATATVDVAATIIARPEVKQVRVITGEAIAPNQAGTPTVDVKRLTPGTTYYFRFYTIGHDQTTHVQYRTLYAVGSLKKADPTLKSIRTSHGRLSPAFSKTRYTYSNVIAARWSSAKITVVPTVASSKVQMKVGSGSWSTVKSKTVSVSKGKSKTVYIKVTEWNHHIVANYSVKVTRKRS